MVQEVSRLVAAKSRVAPISATSVPRLELMAAVLGCQLTQHICKVLGTAPGDVAYWTDSMTVLLWLRSYSRRFKPFVANRVGLIQNDTNPQQWRHVPTADNPADLVSRGASVQELTSNTKWWQGPGFLKLVDGSAWLEMNLKEKPSLAAAMNAEQKKLTSHSVGQAFVNHSGTEPQPDRYSSWMRLVRVTAWVNRFVANCRGTEKVSGELDCAELESAKLEIVARAQQEVFGEELRCLKKGKTLPSSSRLTKMCPKLDSEGLLRCDGRTQRAEWIPFDMRFPIILPRKHHVTSLIVKHYHEQRYHAGTNDTLAALSERFWVEAAREEIRDWEAQCMVCRKRKARTAEQIMAPLPKSRLATPLRAFARSSVDYGGPYLTKHGRGRSKSKRYLCLFTCLLTRAVHLEMSYGLDCDLFLNAFARMASRRGLPLEVISDNGKNFIAADRELKELVEALDDDVVRRSLANRGVTWKFNPPLAPHFGGVHEIMIKAAKQAIKSVLGDADVTDEMLTTAFTCAEGLINARPLTYQTANPSDTTPLTPNHFLMGQVGGQFAPESVDIEGFNPRKRWRQVQELVRQFWKRWLTEWVPTLNARRKWLRERRDLEVGDVALVVQPDTPRGHWPLGRIKSTKPGADGHVRVVNVRIGDKVFTRPITKICPLEA